MSSEIVAGRSPIRGRVRGAVAALALLAAGFAAAQEVGKIVIRL
jgi:hypothetical protein